MNSLMLTLAMTAGQGPGGIPSGPGYYPVLPTAAPVGRPVGRPVVLPDVIQLPVGAQQPGMPPMQPMPTQPGTNPATPPAANGNGNGNGCDPCAEEEKEEAPEPWALMRVLKGTGLGERLEKQRIEISGWTEGNYTASTANRSNFPVTFNDRGDFWQMNQNFLRIDRSIDTSKKEFQLGGRTEWILPGTDARFTPARGLFDDQTGDYRIDLFQAYIDAYMPNVGPQGTTLRIGKFSTHCEYELVQGAETPFLSRSYLFLYNPFTHTGAWAITPLNDTWTMSNGIVLGNDNFIGAPARPTYLGQLKWAPKEGKSTVLFNTSVTNPTFDAGENFAFYNVYNIQVTRKFGEKLSGAVDIAASHMDGIPDVGTAWWYGAAAYAFYQFSDKWNLAFRQELFEDDKGVRTGFAGLYSGTTLGVGFTPVRSLMLRPSVRYDHNFDSNPWEGNRNLFTACMDVIVRW